MPPLPSPFFAAIAILFFTSPSESLVESQPVAAVDNIAPTPPSQIQASDRPEDSGGHIVIIWAISPDDQLNFLTSDNTTFQATAGTTVFPARHGLSGYRIYRSTNETEAVFIGQVGAGKSFFVDAQAQNGVRYLYEVRAFDDNHEISPEIVPNSPADQARTAWAIDNTFVPVDSQGNLILGWFNRRDATVGFDDFFLFADHFGQVDGEINFARQFDLDGNHRINFADFFIFAENFGKTVANFDALPIN